MSQVGSCYSCVAVTEGTYMNIVTMLDGEYRSPHDASLSIAMSVGIYMSPPLTLPPTPHPPNKKQKQKNPPNQPKQTKTPRRLQLQACQCGFQDHSSRRPEWSVWKIFYDY